MSLNRAEVKLYGLVLQGNDQLIPDPQVLHFTHVQTKKQQFLPPNDVSSSFSAKNKHTPSSILIG